MVRAFGEELSQQFLEIASRWHHGSVGDALETNAPLVSQSKGSLFALSNASFQRRFVQMEWSTGQRLRE